MSLICLLLFLPLTLATDNTHFYPITDTTPEIQFVVFPGLYLNPNGTARTDVPGVFGSCQAVTFGIPMSSSRLTFSDTCSTYIISPTDIGCLDTNGDPCIGSWDCQYMNGPLVSNVPMCGCNLNDPNSCPNGGTCVQLVENPGAGYTTLDRDDTPPHYGSGTILVELSRRASFCQCASPYEHYTRFGVSLGQGEEAILAPCSTIKNSSLASICGPGSLASALYFDPFFGNYTINYNLFMDCYSEERGTPGCGLDVLPCVCGQGRFGPSCGALAYDNAHCAYKDGESTAPEDWDPLNLCEGRGICGWDGIYQDPKLPAISGSVVKCVSCDDGFFGQQCRVTCGGTGGSSDITEPACPPHASCINNGTWTAPDPICACKSGYRDPRNDGEPGNPTDDSTNCVTCTNELDVDVPNCTSHNGDCPLDSYTCFNLGCPAGNGYKPVVPLRCTCPPEYVDLGCGITRTASFLCGNQDVNVTCTFEGLRDIADYRHVCSWNTVLDTGTNPSEQWDFSGTCRSISLVDPDFLASDSKLRMLTGDSACAAIRDQCGGQLAICPIPFQRVAATVGDNFFCDTSQARNNIKAAVYARSIYCWRTAADTSGDVFRCLTVPGSDFVVDCSLSVNWDQYHTRPKDFARVFQSKCVSLS